MKISNSKKQLARIINENGGWRDGMSFSWYGNKTKKGYFGELRPRFDRVSGSMVAYGELGVNVVSFECTKLPNWHQTILSRDEYFHLYSAPDAEGWIEWKGGECPVDGNEIIDIRYPDSREEFGTKAKFRRWNHCGDKGDIIAYRLHKPKKSLEELCGEVKEENKHEHIEAKPTIEQLAADYRNAKDYAERKQQEADAAKADAEAKLAELVAAGKALGLALSVTGAESEPELAIIDWRDLRVGDVVWYGGDDELSSGEYHVMGIEFPDYEGYRTVLVNGDRGGHWVDTREGWSFIRRPT